jgi:hypothetical protein
VHDHLNHYTFLYLPVKFVRKKFALKRIHRYRTQILVVFIAFLGTAYSFIGITSWKFSVVGDEWACFTYARGIARQHLLVNPFGLHGVYGQQQVLESYYQAIFLFLFGGHYTAWKAANMVTLFPSVIVLYTFVQKLYGKNAAVIAALLLAFSKYLCNIFKVGNPHCLGFFLFILCVYFASELLFALTLKNALKLGIGLGLSFFVYMGPIFSFFLIPFFLAIFRRHKTQALKPICVVGLVFLGFVIIGLGTTPIAQWSSIATKSSLNREFDSNIQIVLNVAHNFLLFFDNFDYLYNHFVAGPYLDVISRWAALIGIILCAFAFHRKEGLLLFLWVFLCVGIGLTNPYRYTPSTRGIFFIPYGVTFAGIGLEFLRRKLGTVGSRVIIPIGVVIAITLNIYEAQIGVFKKVGYTRTALIMRELSQPHQYNTSIMVYHSNKYCCFDPQHVTNLMSVYGIPMSRFKVTTRFDDVCTTRCDVVIIFKDDPVFRQQSLSDRCPDLHKRVSIKVIQGYNP